jgi:hypothetical protein
MILPDPDNDWDKPWVFGQMMKRAQGRCLNVAESERLLGYVDSYQVYREMASEFRGLDLWMIKEAWERSGLLPGMPR